MAVQMRTACFLISPSLTAVIKSLISLNLRGGGRWNIQDGSQSQTKWVIEGQATKYPTATALATQGAEFWVQRASAKCKRDKDKERRSLCVVVGFASPLVVFSDFNLMKHCEGFVFFPKRIREFGAVLGENSSRFEVFLPPPSSKQRLWRNVLYSLACVCLISIKFRATFLCESLPLVT